MSASRLKASLRKVSANPELVSGKDLVLCISVGQSVHYNEHLLATYLLLTDINRDLKENKKLPGIKSITLSVNGVLQRHNFWYFACAQKAGGNHIKPLSDKELETALKDLPEKPSEDELALLLAERFLPYARTAEARYITAHNALMDENYRLHIRLRSIPFQIKTWDNWLTDDQYNSSLQNLVAQYNENIPLSYEGKQHTLQGDFAQTSVDILNSSKKKKIIEASERIIKIRPDLVTIDWMKVAKHASLRYLLEECPIIIPMWKDKHVIYPAPMTPAFKITAAATQTLVNWHQLNFANLELTQEDKSICAIVNLKSSVSAPVSLSSSPETRPVFLPPTLSQETQPAIHEVSASSVLAKQMGTEKKERKERKERKRVPLESKEKESNHPTSTAQMMSLMKRTASAPHILADMAFSTDSDDVELALLDVKGREDERFLNAETEQFIQQSLSLHVHKLGRDFVKQMPGSHRSDAMRFFKFMAYSAIVKMMNESPTQAVVPYTGKTQVPVKQ